MSNIPRNISGNLSDSWQYGRCATNCPFAFWSVNVFMAGVLIVMLKNVLGLPACKKVQETLS